MSDTALDSLRETQLAFAHHLRDPDHAPKPGDVPEARAAVYRELFFNNIQNALNKAFPVAREITPREQWLSLARDFWREHRSHAPEFPRVPAEFLTWFAARETANTWEPEYLYELLIWEHAELETLLSEDDPVLESKNILEGVPVLSLSLRVHAFQYPAQQISPAFQPTEPLAQPVFLACFRNPALDVDFMSISPAAAWLLEHVSEAPSLTGREHLQALAEALGAQPAEMEEEGRALLERFIDRGVIVGAQ